MAKGIPNHPCDAKSRWRKYAFSYDDAHKIKPGVLTFEGSGPYIVRLDNKVRAVMSDLGVIDPKVRYKFCNIWENGLDGRVGGMMTIRPEKGRCSMSIENPRLDFTNYEHYLDYIVDLRSGNLQPIDEEWTNGEELILMGPSLSSTCNNIPVLQELGDSPIFGQLLDGSWLQFDPRLDLKTNTVVNPKNDGGYAETKLSRQTLCVNAPRTFLNEDKCTMLSTESCQPTDKFDGDDNVITLVNTKNGLVCGSRGEVQNKKEQGFIFDFSFGTDLGGYNSAIVWLMVVQNAPDQLRQRVAWALSQVKFYSIYFTFSVIAMKIIR